VLWLLHLLQEQLANSGGSRSSGRWPKLGLRPINVWELISFYPMFTAKPRGKFHIKVCRTLSCELVACGGILERLQKKKLGVGLDQNTGDGQFNDFHGRMLAACGTGPVMMINDELFENLTADKAEAIIDRIRRRANWSNSRCRRCSRRMHCEKRVLLANMSKPGYKGTIDDYIREGGYKALPKALGMKPEDIHAEVKNSEMRGPRRAPGFPSPSGILNGGSSGQRHRVSRFIWFATQTNPNPARSRIASSSTTIHINSSRASGVVLRCRRARCLHVHPRGDAVWREDSPQAIEEARAKNFLGKNYSAERDSTAKCTFNRGAGAYICGEENRPSSNR